MPEPPEQPILHDIPGRADAYRDGFNVRSSRDVWNEEMCGRSCRDLAFDLSSRLLQASADQSRVLSRVL